MMHDACRNLRRLLVAAAVLCAALLLSPAALAQNADDGFDPDAGRYIFAVAVAVQPDGKILLVSKRCAN